jgi:hypothetical protein
MNASHQQHNLELPHYCALSSVWKGHKIHQIVAWKNELEKDNPHEHISG